VAGSRSDNLPTRGAPDGLGGKASTLLRLREHFEIPDLIAIDLGGGVPPDLSGLDAFVRSQPTGARFAVRSSANVEDSTDSSFAGLFETRLGVPRTGLLKAMRDVRASVETDRVEAYCAARSIDQRQIRMSVAVQRMVAATRSGVCFTRSPDQDAEDILTVEAVYGLGEPLVRGDVSPDAWGVRRDDLSVSWFRGSHQTHRTVLGSGAGIVSERVPSTQRRAVKLSSSDIDRIARLALSVERHEGSNGVDIEWAIDDEGLWLLQARPITT